MDFIKTIQIICEDLKLTSPGELKSSLYLITINKKDDLYIVENENRTGFCIYSFLFPALPEYKSQLSSKINELNTFGKITKTAVISLSQEDDAFLLSEQFLYNNIQTDLFLNRIKEFYNIVCFFKKEWPKWQIEILTENKKSISPSLKKHIISP